MAERAGLMELAERVERLTTKSWDIDKEIFLAVHAPKIWFGSKVIAWFGDGPFGCNTEDGNRHLNCINAPNYTSSLDVAMSLVPVGEAAQVTRYADGRGHCVVGFGNSVIAATPALALTAACLRARASANERGE